ncbi:hypothetical protein [Persicirhabdus sediminis]|uniref:Uncharacterized protein n=1 Tax=Persicirhabdus sediminis TaxID=454144 RepID=A0A8J7MH43_9BACT|nr:hypothetical protein [Persicirhabdus sediminis]MBK1792860.1 hypothetical protein [Persicirhabdus sediminis]
MNFPKVVWVSLLATIGYAVLHFYTADQYYQAGLQIKSLIAGNAIYGDLLKFCFFIVMLVCWFVGLFRVFTQKKYQPAVICTVMLAISLGMKYIPVPTYFDGIEQAVAENDQAFYQALREEVLLADQTVDKSSSRHDEITMPAEIYEKYPRLGELFPDHYSFEQEDVRYKIEDDALNIFRGNGLVGHHGVRIYKAPKADPYEGVSEYIGSFRKVYPTVYTYCRSY